MEKHKGELFVREFEVDVAENQVRVAMHGLICKEEAALLRKTFHKYTEEGYADFVVDFTDVNYIDRFGQEVMLDMNQSMKDMGGHFAVTGLRGLVKDLFEFTGVVALIEIN